MEMNKFVLMIKNKQEATCYVNLWPKMESCSSSELNLSEQCFCYSAEFSSVIPDSQESFSSTHAPFDQTNS